VCSFQAVNPVILWSRFFEVREGLYNAVAFIENPNADSMAENVPYSFKLRDSENVLVYERKGVTDIPAQQRVPIVETDIATGVRVPVRIFFEFTADPDWRRVAGERPLLKVTNINLQNVETTPKLSAVLENRSLVPASDVEVVAILLGDDGNAIAVSRTIVEFIGEDDSTNLIFTWPESFESVVAEVLVIPKVF